MDAPLGHDRKKRGSANRKQHIDRLNEALRQQNQPEICLALMAEARRQGIMTVAKRAAMTRSSLYSALNANGNPTLAVSLRISSALDIGWTAHSHTREKDERE
jgi:probable addiction module antidote protein